MGLIIRFLISAAGLWLAAYIVPGVVVSDTGTLLIAALLLGIVNAVVRPVVTVLTLPITFLTLGLFLLVVNAAMIGLVALLLSGFAVNGLVPGVMAAIVTGVVGWIGDAVTSGMKRRG